MGWWGVVCRTRVVWACSISTGRLNCPKEFMVNNKCRLVSSAPVRNSFLPGLNWLVCFPMLSVTPWGTPNMSDAKSGPPPPADNVETQ